jgi:large subunit ribosomal protein L18
LSQIKKKNARIKRHRRVRKKLSGTPERLRLSVFKSVNHIYAQIIDDVSGTTLLTTSTLNQDVRERVKNSGNIEAAKVVGEVIGKKALENNILNVVFDRGGYHYHGRVKALAEAAREAGLIF